MALGWRPAIGMGLGALRHRLFGTRVPLNVMLAVTDRCTNRCAYCRIPELGRPDPPLEKLLDLIRQMHRAGAWRIGLWGGEPLIRNDIAQIVGAAKEQGMYVTLDTNAALIDKRMDAVTMCDHVIVAYDGDKQAHEANRCAGSHVQALHALETLPSKVDTWTITVLTKNNLDQVDHILDLAEQLGFFCTFQVVHHNTVLGAPVDDFMPDQHALRETIGHLIDRLENGARIASSRAYLEYLRAWPDFREPKRTRPVGDLDCLAGDLFCNVDVDGKMYPCSLLVGTIQAPNAFDLGFAPAFARLDRNGCAACNASCYVEYNHLFALRPAVIQSWLATTRKRK